jgi:ABC-type uncharacterized transport system permease subunit
MTSLLTDRGLLWIATALYLGGFVVGCIQLLLRRSNKLTDRTLLVTLLAFGLSSQTAGLYVRGMATGGCPLGNQFEIVQFVAWSAMVLYFVVGPAFRVSLLGLFTSGYAAGLAAISLAIPQWDAVRNARIFPSPWIEFHAALAVFSYGVFGLLALTSFMHLLQNWALKQKRLDGLFWFLPSVVQLDQINWRMLLAGVGLLTVSLSVGSVYFVQKPVSVNWLKLSVTIAVWAVYSSALLLRWRGRLYATRFSWACIILFMLAMMSLGPVNANTRAHRVELTPEQPQR